MKNDIVSRSFFAVSSNPEKHGYSGEPEEIVEKMKEEWVSGNPRRKGFWAYCISVQGLPHVHMVLEGSGAMRFSAVKKVYPKAHLEATKGSKKQVLSYVRKEPPFDEKGETVVCCTSYGNIEGHKRFALSNINDTMQAIEQMIEDGATPEQIMAEDIRFRKEETLIRKAYFAKRYKETPPIREVKVFWHLGDAGAGKSYAYVMLCEEYEDDKVYLFTDYANHGVGGFDNYCGERILFLDELKRGSLPFEFLLTIMQGYRTQIHCRYSNCFSLWNEVHIASIYSPEDIYAGMVNREDRSKDPIKQLLRRITYYVYHYKDEEGYKTFELEGSKYQNYNNLKSLALGKDGFCHPSNESIPF